MQAATDMSRAVDNPQALADAHRVLMARVAADHDRAAFRELYLYFGPRIKALMLKGGAELHLADDIVQEVMATMWRKVDLYVPERGTVAAWVFTIARNARIDRIRRGSSRAWQDIDDLDLVSEDANGEDTAIARQRAERVAHAMDELPEEQRRIIEMAYVEDMAQSEIATALDLPLGTVKSRMRLAYAKLKDKLGELQ